MIFAIFQICVSAMLLNYGNAVYLKRSIGSIPLAVYFSWILCF